MAAGLSEAQRRWLRLMVDGSTWCPPSAASRALLARGYAEVVGTVLSPRPCIRITEAGRKYLDRVEWARKAGVVLRGAGS